MPDFTTHAWYVCESNFSAEFKFMSSDGVTEYTTRLARYNPGPYQVNWHCNCPGFLNHGHCKHVTEADELNCFWGQGAFSGSPVMPEPTDGKCPDCGRKLRVIEVAV